MTPKKPELRHASYLSPPEMFRLDLACAPLREAFPSYGPYLVGSVTQRRDFRDVDVRCVLVDEEYDALFPPERRAAVIFLGLAVTAYLREATGLPIDFQFQRASEANERHNTFRNSLGLRHLVDFAGDGHPPMPPYSEESE